MKPLCFVLMPFGKKTDTAGRLIDFNAVYQNIIAPAIEQAGLEPLRADEEMAGGIIHKPMFERLVLCEYAIADLTTANANVFYELGVRHAAKPWHTLLLFAEGGKLPFDVAPLRAMPYMLDGEGKPASPDTAIAAIKQHLLSQLGAQAPTTDSPLYQLLNDYPNIQHEKTDVFRDRVNYAKGVKRELATARVNGIAAVRQAEQSIADAIKADGGTGLMDAEAGILVDLLLSYRAVSGWPEMITLIERFKRPLADAVMVREQYAFALNRAKRDRDAETVLQELIEKHGPSSENCGLLGRIYKDRWQADMANGETLRASAWLQKAVASYTQGFETDWRDAYPGVNALTLMECQDPPSPARLKLLPVVRYAVERRVARGKPDYWDHATLLELAILANDEGRAKRHLGDALAAVREKWEPETTLNNLRMIQKARGARGDESGWIGLVMKELE